MKKYNFSKYLLVISIMTFLALFVVVMSNSYDNLMKSIITAQNNSLGKPIDMDLKIEVINLIESRR
jgi:hypothetical protein